MEEKLIAAIEKNTAAVLELIELQRASMNQQSEWVTYKEASMILGLSPTTGNSKRRIDNAVKRYKLRYQNTRPRRYSREDIVKLNAKVMEGRWVLIGN